MNIEVPKNKNYCGIVVALTNFVTLPNCDKVKATLIFGNSIIIDKKTEVGAVGVYFPVETALSAAFLSYNNLYSKPEYGNADPTKKNYFEQHGRIKAVKFRGHKSEGFWIPLNAFEFTGVADKLVVGMEFDKLNGWDICHKYIPKKNRSSNPCTKNNRLGPARFQIVDNQFRLHIDTAKLDRNIHRITPDTIISITDKWHGTSAVFANILVKRPLNWFERLLARYVGIFGVQVKDIDYGYTWSSRKIIKGVNGNVRADANHYYGTDVWGTVFKEIEAVVPKGYTIYGEIVGFSPSGGAIQGGYHYQCEPGNHRFLVYRVTVTNADGKVLEMSWPQLKEFCFRSGLETVKELYYGRAGDCFAFMPKVVDQESLDQWQTAFLQGIKGTYVRDLMCEHNNKEVPAEGVVVKVDRLDQAESYKVKSFLFLKRESDENDKGVVDMETEESEDEAPEGVLVEE